MESIGLEQAVRVARIVEAIVKTKGYHVALTGSVLFNGHSEKDIDLVLYPHKEKEQLSFEEIMEPVVAAGFELVKHHDNNGYPGRQIMICSFATFRVDFFYFTYAR